MASVSLFKFDMWSSWLQNDIDKDRAVMDTINALVVVVSLSCIFERKTLES